MRRFKHASSASKPATTPIPVQLSAIEFHAFILPHLSMPSVDPMHTRLSQLFNLILWVLYTGMQWKCLPVPTDTAGKPAIHYTTVYKVFAGGPTTAHLRRPSSPAWRICGHNQLDLSVLHGDGTNTVPKKRDASAIPA